MSDARNVIQLPCLPLEIWQLIYYFMHDLRPVHQELLSNCARREVEVLDNDYNGGINRFEMALHKSIHPLYSDTQYWKEHGYCSVKCWSFNWPHACNFCMTCNADPDYCTCG
jgi:hypothetical protein